MKRRSRPGFTNCMAIVLILLLAAGLIGSFLLAYLSIMNQYTGALACWTICFTPLSTALGIVLGKIVDKSKAENTSGDKGIKYAAAEAAGFVEESSINSPPI